VPRATRRADSRGSPAPATGGNDQQLGDEYRDDGRDEEDGARAERDRDDEARPAAVGRPGDEREQARVDAHRDDRAQQVHADADADRAVPQCEGPGDEQERPEPEGDARGAEEEPGGVRDDVARGRGVSRGDNREPDEGENDSIEPTSVRMRLPIRAALRSPTAHREAETAKAHRG